MTTDIARVTYDPTRQYRSVVSQQGRVTLEADCNEAALLETEALRLETIDVIGPTGTPDDGYKVGPGNGPGGVAIGTGILYLGGWRLENDQPIDLSQQPDWLDAPPFTTAQGNLSVALLLTEQSVGAVEDQALREVALGGPDSAARRRLLQRFLRIPIQGSTCAAGASAISALLATDGVSIDPASCALVSSARLEAGFVPGPATTDPCTPAAAGGYLGADNQMVRVTVTAFDPKAQTGTLLWGWNNASLLYRASFVDPMTLTLATVPVDQEHAPQQNQVVEILRSTTNLGDNNFIADGAGFIVRLAQGYSFDTGEIALSTALPAEFQKDKSPLFVRVWQAEVNFQAGKATALDATSGITVAITMAALPSQIAARPYWHFSVRPSTPQSIYPQRYSEAPQPPDGPRQWITELAVVQAAAQGSTVLASCRVPFLPLTEQSSGCCGLVLGPNDVAGRGGLQAVADSLSGQPAVLSLRPGTYPLGAPLTLTKQHNGLTIEGCTAGVILQAAGSDMTPFRTGLVSIDGIAGVTLRRLEIKAPVTAAGAGVQFNTMIGIHVGTANALTIDSCTFDLAAPSAATFGGGIFVAGATVQVTLKDNNFTASGGGETFGVAALVTASNASAELDQWEVCGNRFNSLTYAVLGLAQLGLVTCRANIVVNCASGLVFAEANLGQTSAFARAAFTATDNTGLGTVVQATLRPDLIADALTKVAPIVAALPPVSTPSIPDSTRKVLTDQLQTSGAALYKAVAVSPGLTATEVATSAAPATPQAMAVRAAETIAPGTTIAPGATVATGATAAAGTTVAAGTTAATGTTAAPGTTVATGAAAAKTTISTTNLDVLDAVAIAAGLLQRQLTPALRFEGNEVGISSANGSPWFGLGALLSRDEPGSVMVIGNRVVVPTAATEACGIMFPSAAVVTGNLFAQLVAAAQGTTAVPSLVLLADTEAIMVASNVNSFTERVLPARATKAVTTSWEFLNTTG